MADVLERALPHWGKEELHTAQFENGFRVIYKHVDRPVTHCGLVINAGTRDEIAAQGEAGVAHFIEHEGDGVALEHAVHSFAAQCIAEGNAADALKAVMAFNLG